MPTTPPPIVAAAMVEAQRRTRQRGHRLGDWQRGLTYRGGERDWWASCVDCRAFAWVLERPTGASVQHLTQEACPGPRSGVRSVPASP
jgi:hypothetical protein